MTEKRYECIIYGKHGAVIVRVYGDDSSEIYKELTRRKPMLAK